MSKGKPNIGPYPCGGILIINPPHAGSRFAAGSIGRWRIFREPIRRGARRFESQSLAANLAHVAVENPDGQKVLILTNLGAARTVQVNQGLSSAMVTWRRTRSRHWCGSNHDSVGRLQSG